VSHLSACGISIHKGGYEPTNTLDISIQKALASGNHVLHRDDQHRLFIFGITTLGDIAAYISATRSWVPSSFSLKHFPALANYIFPSQLTYTQLLRPGLCYSTRQTFLSQHAGAFEILGTVDSGDIAIRLWAKSTRTTRFRKTPNPFRLQLHQTSFSKGSATNLVYPYSLLFPPATRHVVRIILSEDLHTTQGTERAMLSQFLSTPPPHSCPPNRSRELPPPPTPGPQPSKH
jgi:hypothetical protein